MSTDHDSVYRTRAAVFAAVMAGRVDATVVSELVRDGRGIGDEAVLWDFKRELPVRPPDGASRTTLATYDAKMHEVVKDAVAFHNSFGGYLVSGVEDGSRELTGHAAEFDAATLNQKIQGATGVGVECVFRTVGIDVGATTIRLGLLFIPRRPADRPPLQFRKAAPQGDGGPPAYGRDQFYMRERDACRPAVTSEDFEFLFSDRRRQVSEFVGTPARLLENNLPPRDPDLGGFIGRSDELSELWSWLADPFSPVKLVTGLGGLGKTSLSYTFAERFAYEAPGQYDKLIWLGAKQTTFSAIRGGYSETTRVDFGDVDGFLRQLLEEVGCPPSMLAEAETRSELSELLLQHLEAFRYLVVIDDVDTLDDEQQEQLHYAVFQVFSRTRTKGLLTARRNLGVPRTQYVELQGLDETEFANFVVEKSGMLGIPAPCRPGSTDMKRFREVTGGSPLFALSVLRLVSLGDRFDRALSHWAGADGEQVREAAFRKEIGRLLANEARVLLCAIHLVNASQIELASILQLSRYEVQQALDRLRQFSMVGIASDLPGGVTLTVPRPLALMADVVSGRVGDHRRIKEACESQRRLKGDPTAFVRDVIRRGMAFLRQRSYAQAIDTLEAGLRALPDDPELLVMLGRCYVENGSATAGEAEDVLRRAFENGANRIELFDNWMRAKEVRGDWRGVIEVSSLAKARGPLGPLALRRAEAFVRQGDTLVQSNAHEDAEKVYVEGAEDLRAVLAGGLPGYLVRDVRQAQARLVSRWMGVLRTICDKPGKMRRLFGAVTKTVFDYKMLDVDRLRMGLHAADLWLTWLEARGGVAVRNAEAAQVDLQRVRRLNGIVAVRNLPDDVTLEVRRFAQDFEARVRALGIALGGERHATG